MARLWAQTVTSRPVPVVPAVGTKDEFQPRWRDHFDVWEWRVLAFGTAFLMSHNDQPAA